MVAKRIGNAVIITDPEERIVWVNEGFSRLTGLSLEKSSVFVLGLCFNVNVQLVKQSIRFESRCKRPSRATLRLSIEQKTDRSIVRPFNSTDP